MCSAREWVLQTNPSHVSTVALDWSEIMVSYNTPVTVVSDRSTMYRSWAVISGRISRTCIWATSRRRECVVEASWMRTFDADVCDNRLLGSLNAGQHKPSQGTHSIFALHTQAKLLRLHGPQRSWETIMTPTLYLYVLYIVNVPVGNWAPTSVSDQQFFVNFSVQICNAR